MDTDADRNYDFWPIIELPDINLDQEFVTQIRNIMVILNRHIFILTRHNMRYELLRLITFILYFPRNTRLDLRAFATSGFYFTRERDYVVCYRCGFCKGNWAERDDPREIHQRFSPLCDFFHNRGVNIPFFNINEGGLRRMTEITTVNERISPGPVPVFSADEMQQHIIQVLGGTHPEFDRRIVFSNRDYINAQPMVDLRLGRQLVGNSSLVVNEISLTVNDLQVNLRRDLLHSFTVSESELTLHTLLVRQNECHRASNLSLSRRSNITVAIEDVQRSESLHSIPGIFTAEESEVQAGGRRLNQDQNSSYDSIDYRNETDETQLKTLFEPEINANNAVINDRSEQISDNVSVLVSSYKTATLENTYRKALDIQEDSTENDNDESSQDVLCSSTEEKEVQEWFHPRLQEAVLDESTTPKTVVSDGKYSNNAEVLRKHNNEPLMTIDSSGSHDLTKYEADVTTSTTDIKAKADTFYTRHQGTETDETSAPNSVVSDRKDSNNAQFKALPEHTNKPVKTPISKGAHDLKEDAAENITLSSNKKVKAANIRESTETVYQSHQGTETDETSTPHSVVSDGKDSNNAQFKAFPEHSNKPVNTPISKEAHDLKEDAAENITLSSNKKAKAANRRESTETVYQSPQETETDETSAPNSVISDGKDSNNAQFKALPEHTDKPVKTPISKEAHDLKEDAAENITLSSDKKAKAGNCLLFNPNIPGVGILPIVPSRPEFDIPNLPTEEQNFLGFIAQEECALAGKREQKGLTDHNISEKCRQRIGTVVKEEDHSNEPLAKILQPSEVKHSLPRPFSDPQFSEGLTSESGTSLPRSRHFSQDSTFDERHSMLAAPFPGVRSANCKFETDSSNTILLRNKKSKVAACSCEEKYLKQFCGIRDRPIGIPFQFGCFNPDGSTKTDDNNDIANDMRKTGFLSRKILNKEELCSKTQESFGDESEDEELFEDDSEQCSITEKNNFPLCQQKKSYTSEKATTELESAGASCEVVLDQLLILALEHFNNIKDPMRKKFVKTQFIQSISEERKLDLTDSDD